MYKKKKYIHGYNIHIYAHVLDRKWIFLLIKHRYNSDNLCRHFFKPEKQSSLPFNGKLTKKRKAWEDQHCVLQRDKGMQTQA